MTIKNKEYIASGPELSDCSQIRWPPRARKRFWRYGGQDIRVWGTRYEIDATSERAVYYAAAILDLHLRCPECGGGLY